MAVLRIAKMGNPILRTPAAPVDDPTAPEISKLAADMQETLEDIGASGLAANQVFVSQRIVVYRMMHSRIPEGSGFGPVPWTVMVNPIIAPLDEEKKLYWERCLSIPGLHGKVPRWPKIRISYQNLEGEYLEQEAIGTWSALLQHECDHLDGYLYPMRMNDLSLLSYNDEPGPLAQDAAAGNKIDPLFQRLVDDWPARPRWLGK
jgi:peptide deformylase